MEQALNGKVFFINNFKQLGEMKPSPIPGVMKFLEMVFIALL